MEQGKLLTAEQAQAIPGLVVAGPGDQRGIGAGVEKHHHADHQHGQNHAN